MSKSIIAFAFAVLSIPVLASSASAAPAGLGSTKPAIAADAATTQVTWGHRRCHRNVGEGRCHRKRHFYRDAGVKLFVGPGRHHHKRHWKRHWKHHD